MTSPKPTLLDTVALLRDYEPMGLIQGQVGAVVELLGDDQALVEFCDSNGETYAMPTLPMSALLRLAYERVAA